MNIDTHSGSPLCPGRPTLARLHELVNVTPCSPSLRTFPLVHETVPCQQTAMLSDTTSEMPAAAFARRSGVGLTP